MNKICPCCKATLLPNNIVINGFFEFECKICDHTFFTHIKDQLVIIDENLYKNDIDYNNDLLLAKDYNNLIQWNHLRAYQYIKTQEKIKTVLDVGTYNGFFVKFLQTKGFNAKGYDFNNDAIEYGIENYKLGGLVTSDLNDLKNEDFDCITAFEVIEHLEFPEQFIQDITKYLKPNGLLLLSCPNSKMIWRPLVDYPPHHLSRFSPKSLWIFIKNMNFEIVKLEEQFKIYDLIRNFVGAFFRDKRKISLKGGQYRNMKRTNFLRNKINRSRLFFYWVLYPIDIFFHWLGLRYISQLIIARKINSPK